MPPPPLPFGIDERVTRRTSSGKIGLRAPPRLSAEPAGAALQELGLDFRDCRLPGIGLRYLAQQLQQAESLQQLRLQVGGCDMAAMDCKAWRFRLFFFLIFWLGCFTWMTGLLELVWSIRADESTFCRAQLVDDLGLS